MLAVCLVLVLIPATFILSALMGVDGVLWAGPVSDTLAAVFAAAMLRAKWKKIFPANPSGIAAS